jgi:hypothetical protein
MWALFSMWSSMVLVIEQVFCNMIVGKKEVTKLPPTWSCMSCTKHVPNLSSHNLESQFSLEWPKSECGKLVKVILNSLCYEISANKTFKVFRSPNCPKCRRLSIQALFSFLIFGDAFQSEWRQRRRRRRRRRRSLFELTETSHAPYKCLETCTGFLERCDK